MTAAAEPKDDHKGQWVMVTSPDGNSVHAGYLLEHTAEQVVIRVADGQVRGLPPSYAVEAVPPPRNLATPPDPLQEPRSRPDEPDLVPMGRRKRRNAPRATDRMVPGVTESDLRTVLAAASGIKAWMLLAGSADLPEAYDRIAKALRGTGGAR